MTGSSKDWTGSCPSPRVDTPGSGTPSCGVFWQRARGPPALGRLHQAPSGCARGSDHRADHRPGASTQWHDAAAEPPAASLGPVSLEFWELMSVAPAQRGGSRGRQAATDPGTRPCAAPGEAVRARARRIHHSTPTTPEEDWRLLVPSFQAFAFHSAFGLEEYGRWLQDEADMGWAYRELKQRLQIILHQRPRQRLVLKAPDHIWFIDALLEVFPDAHIVQAQRDPVDCIASYTSMISLQERMLTGRIEWEPLAARLTDLLLDGARRADEARATYAPSRFCRCPFDELVRDPAAAMRLVADHFGLPAPNEAAVTRELAKPRADGPGAHRYSHERLGLEPEMIHRGSAGRRPSTADGRPRAQTVARPGSSSSTSTWLKPARSATRVSAWGPTSSSHPAGAWWRAPARCARPWRRGRRRWPCPRRGP